MRNGIKKYVIASIPILFGCLFGYGNAYNIVESCTRNSFCVEFDANETVNYDTLNFQGQKGTTNIELSTDTYNNVLAYKFNSNSDKFMTYAYYWSEQGFTTYAGYHGGGSYNINKQTYVCTNTASGYTGCLMEDTSTLWNSTGNLASSDILTENFKANKYVINLYNKGRGSYGPSTFCMIDTTNDMSICIKNDYYTAGDRPRQTLLQTGTNDNSVLYIDSLYTLLATSVPPTNTPIAPSGGGGETTTETTTIIGQCPTINEILSTYSSNYNIGICYSATRLLTQTGIVNTTAQSIFELYPTFTGWLEDYNYYRQYCENVPTSVCREAFSGNEIKRSLLNKTPENNPIGVYQYCHLQLNIQDKNTTTCVMSTGQYFATGVDEAIEEEIQGNQSVLDIMLNSFNNLKDELPSFSSGTVFDEFLEEGETWKDGFKLDIFKTFLELWSKITSIFIFRHQYDGIIPTYITSIIMIILLFKILKK